MLNCLSFDIEGFVESNVQSITIPEGYINRKKEVYEIEKNVEILLELLCKISFPLSRLIWVAYRFGCSGSHRLAFLTGTVI